MLLKNFLVFKFHFTSICVVGLGFVPIQMAQKCKKLQKMVNIGTLRLVSRVTDELIFKLSVAKLDKILLPKNIS